MDTVKGLVWLGIPASDYAAAVRFFGATLGLEVAFDEGTTWNWPPATAKRFSYSAPSTGTVPRRSHWPMSLL